jgi:hypothetical protein
MRSFWRESAVPEWLRGEAFVIPEVLRGFAVLEILKWKVSVVPEMLR